MKILAVEFSSERRSVAVLVDGAVRGRAEETGGRTARAFALIEAALAEAGCRRDEIAHLAVGLGPGSYAGIRASIALAQGWQVARPISVAGISSVEALVHQAETGDLAAPRLNVVLDAQRQEFYFAAYARGPKGWRVLEPLSLLDRAETSRRCREGVVLVPPKLESEFPGSLVRSPDAAAVAKLAWERREFGRAAQLEPIYLRPVAFVKAPSPRILPVS